MEAARRVAARRTSHSSLRLLRGRPSERPLRTANGIVRVPARGQQDVCNA